MVDVDSTHREISDRRPVSLVQVQREQGVEGDVVGDGREEDVEHEAELRTGFVGQGVDGCEKDLGREVCKLELVGRRIKTELADRGICCVCCKGQRSRE